MLTLNTKYILKRRGLLTKDNESFLTNVYLPLIGYKAYFLYLYLVHLYKNNLKDSKISYIIENTGLNLSEFILSKKTLESIGLIQTLTDDNVYVFIIKSALLPNDFFSNPVLKGLLVNKIGKDESLRIMKKYEVDEVDFENFKDISAGIKESFVLNFSKEDIDLKKENSLISYNKNSVKDNFSDKKFLNYVKANSNIDVDQFDIEVLSKIHGFAVLYGLNEKIMSLITIDSLSDENKFNLKYIKTRCEKEANNFHSYNKKNIINLNSNTDIANRINYYENTSPIVFLKNKLNGAKPSKYDVDIINKLNDNYNFNNGVINIIIEYTLNKLDGKLNCKYIEKVATTLSYKKIKDSITAMDYLNLSNEHDNDNMKKDENASYKKSVEVNVDKLNKELEELI